MHRCEIIGVGPFSLDVKDDNGIAAQIVFNGTEQTPTFTQGKRLFYHNDYSGSTTLITNQSGNVVENSSYDPYGTILEGGELSRFDYEGKEFSSITEDYDFHFRKYDPKLGIFTQPDSAINNLYDPHSLNRYSFERRNPYKYTDPDGHFGVLIIAGALGLAALISFGMSYFESSSSGGSFSESYKAGAQGAGQGIENIVNTAEGFIGFAGSLATAGLFSGVGKTTTSFTSGGTTSSGASFNVGDKVRSIFGGAGRISAYIPKINIGNLPTEAQKTIKLIKQGKTGSLGPQVYENRIIPESGKTLLPKNSDPTYYKRYYLSGVGKNADLRIIAGKNGEIYYSTGHYEGNVFEVLS